MFIDKVKIFIKAGDGGNGCTSFYTEKYVPNGGPDGGDGGNGGGVIIKADKSKASLLDFRYNQRYKADDGEKGNPKTCHGKCAKNLIIKVPPGTVVKDEKTGGIIADLFNNGDEVLVLKGGNGGKGNARFKTSRRQAPHFSQSGEKTEEKTVILEFKTIADVGLVGYPNVGKSTLLSVMSQARPKIANYHFTTLFPNLGAVSCFDKAFVVADIPGLIEGAAAGVGLGHEFLRHIERTRLIVHVVDISGIEGRDPYEDYKKINKELRLYSPILSKLPQLIALNKADILPLEQRKSVISDFKKHIRGKKVITISAVTGENLEELINQMSLALDALPPLMPMEFTPFVYQPKEKFDYEITKLDEGYYEVSGGFVEELARNVVLGDYDSFNYFQKQLKDRGIIKALKKAGANDKDTVRILDLEFDYVL